MKLNNVYKRSKKQKCSKQKSLFLNKLSYLKRKRASLKKKNYKKQLA